MSRAIDEKVAVIVLSVLLAALILLALLFGRDDQCESGHPVRVGNVVVCEEGPLTPGSPTV